MGQKYLTYIKLFLPYDVVVGLFMVGGLGNTGQVSLFSSSDDVSNSLLLFNLRLRRFFEISSSLSKLEVSSASLSFVLAFNKSSTKLFIKSI